ncbi:MAG TPA: glycerophosphodiester phosphodiesterase [Elusimicrobiales bacterium]|nr:glycerophosphodiester phosphodiesterase [Elusimicrobiales bacterium]
MKKILFPIFAALFLAGGTLQAIEVQGHRGSRGTRPEDTLPAFEEALRVGVDVLELDLGVTKDNVVVVSHEQHVSPVICLDAEGKKIETAPLINSLTLEELKKYDCGTLKNPKFERQVPVPGTRIPTLAEVFELAAASKHPGADKVRFNIETKINPGLPGNSPAPADFARLVVEVVKKFNLEDRVIIQSFDYRTLAEVKKLSSKILKAQLTSDDLVAPKDAVNSSGAEILSPYFEWINKDIVELAHKDGLQVIPWTLNEPAYWDKAIEYGVDGIITDYPADLIEYLKAKKLR